MNITEDMEVFLVSSVIRDIVYIPPVENLMWEKFVTKVAGYQ